MNQTFMYLVYYSNGQYARGYFDAVKATEYAQTVNGVIIKAPIFADFRDGE